MVYNIPQTPLVQFQQLTPVISVTQQVKQQHYILDFKFRFRKGVRLFVKIYEHKYTEVQIFAVITSDLTKN